MIHQIVIKWFVTVHLQAKDSELASMRIFLWSDHILEKKTKLFQLKMYIFNVSTIDS